MTTAKCFMVGFLIAVALAAVSSGRAASWKPGTTYYVSESDASDLLERSFDSAYCDGISRFGHHGEFPYEEYLVFDCTVRLNGATCIDVRYKSVKGTRVGWFRLRVLSRGSCF